MNDNFFFSQFDPLCSFSFLLSSRYDRNKSGSLSSVEVFKLVRGPMRVGNLLISDKELDIWIDLLDKKKVGGITVDELTLFATTDIEIRPPQTSGSSSSILKKKSSFKASSNKKDKKSKKEVVVPNGPLWFVPDTVAFWRTESLSVDDKKKKKSSSKSFSSSSSNSKSSSLKRSSMPGSSMSNLLKTSTKTSSGVKNKPSSKVPMSNVQKLKVLVNEKEIQGKASKVSANLATSSSSSTSNANGPLWFVPDQIALWRQQQVVKHDETKRKLAQKRVQDSLDQAMKQAEDKVDREAAAGSPPASFISGEANSKKSFADYMLEKETNEETQELITSPSKYASLGTSI